MLVDQVTTEICIPKIMFNICEVRKMRSDEVFLYITVSHELLNETYILYKHNAKLQWTAVCSA